MKGSFVRNGDNDEVMNAYEVYTYESYRRHTREDLRPVADAKVSLFDKMELKTCLDVMKAIRHDLAETCTDQKIMEVTGVTVNGKPTIVGVMTFSICQQTYFPQLSITASLISGTRIYENVCRFLTCSPYELSFSVHGISVYGMYGEAPHCCTPSQRMADCASKYWNLMVDVSSRCSAIQ